ncbi:MAG: citrate lyase holo-[Synergistaceae bacterium]|nr:citrate lyase holo-[acyl-carrier protein] synthase [Synergistaceae bacterium]
MDRLNLQMTGQEINLSQMLVRREKRSCEQKFLLDKYKSPLISFSMNIPGPVKTNSLIRKAFDRGQILILESLANIHAKINDSIETHENTGDELLLSVSNIPPDELKNLSLKIENDSEIGRLYDIDVIDSNGQKLSRKIFRKCLICDKQAQECARSRNHTVQEMQAAIINLLQEADL